MSLRQGLILAINTSILVVLFVLLAWLYRESRLELEQRVATTLDAAATMAETLGAIKQRELADLARSLSDSPMLRGALATEDRATIVDVLKGLESRNGLSVAAILRGGRPIYAARSPAPGADELSRIKFCGQAPLDERRLVLCQHPGAAMLDEWSAVTGTRFIMTFGGREPAQNLGIADAEWMALREKAAGWERAGVVTLGKKEYYRQRRDLGEGLSLTAFVEKAPLWAGFQRRRNSLVVIGAALFFLGLLLSLGFSELLARHAHQSTATAEWKRLIDEIESLRRERVR